MLPQLLVPDHVCDQGSLEAVLKKTQGYIIIGHGCDYIRYGFVAFSPGAPADVLRQAFAQLGGVVTKAESLNADKQIKEHSKRDTSLVVRAVGISARGYFAMNFPDVFPPDFREGFANRLSGLGLSDSKSWTDVWAGRGRYDALIVIAARQKGALSDECNQMEALFGSSASVIWRDGFVLRDANTHAPRDHFGFVDGVSQPVFFEDQKLRTHPRNFPWDPQAGLGLVLLDELFPAQSGAHELGSYCAFLTIEQDEAAFQNAATALGARVGCPYEQAYELIIGRKKDGRPHIGGGVDLNDIDTDAPDNEVRWPLASHSRRMSFRGGDSHRRILRRGVLYDIGVEKGLFFQSFQKSLASQFEFLLRSWANNPNHPRVGTGLDPIIGSLTKSEQAWPIQNGAGGTARCLVSGLTTIRGGEYFYFPSIPSLLAFPAQRPGAVQSV